MGVDESRRPSSLIFFLALCVGLFALSRWQHAPPAEVLLFDGIGTSRGDVRAFKNLLDRQDVRFDTADADDINRMHKDKLRAYRLLIVPGGNFEEMGREFTPYGRENIRAAVANGMNYLGVCAGAFLAGALRDNHDINLTGVPYSFYSAERRGIRKAPVWITTPGGPPLEHSWEDGPDLTGWGTIIAKYPDGAAAATQGKFENGWVVLSGVHPEAPESWRNGMTFSTPAEVDNAWAAALVDAALHGKWLPYFRPDDAPQLPR